MVKILLSRPIEQYHGTGGTRYVELSCHSRDVKPTSGIANGSVALEVDTGDVFLFDEDAGEWVAPFNI